MKIELQNRGTDAELLGQDCDCLVVMLPSGDVPLDGLGLALDVASGGVLQRLRDQGEWTGKLGQTLWLHAVLGVKAHRVLLVGLGADQLKPQRAFMKAARAVGEAISASRAANIVWPLGNGALQVGAAARALLESDYRYDCYRQPEGMAPPMRRARLVATRHNDLELDLQRALAMAQGVALARDLGNMPPNDCTPSHLAAVSIELGRKWGLDVEVHEREGIAELGMRAFLAVAQGSMQPPRLIVLRYQGGPTDQAPIALVGKGITFDSGGLSLKPAEAMDEMKYDMCGAASVLGTLRACAELKLPLNLAGVIVACENLPSGQALKPGDVVRSMAGQTIEVLNTDAEGRLILCDALTYAQQLLAPELMIDIATLTGACVIALGHVRSGLYANDDTLAAALTDAGERSADLAWRMPLDEDYQEQLKSRIADVANIGGRPGGSITAASFLSRFVHTPWAHLDIAGTAWKSGKEKEATGRTVPLLTQYLIDRTT